MTPTYKAPKFQCPHCKTIATQRWFDSSTIVQFANDWINSFYYDYRTNIDSFEQRHITTFIKSIEQVNNRNLSRMTPGNLGISLCTHCDNLTLWIKGILVYPQNIVIDEPNSDLSQDIKNIYLEAASIVHKSPKGATALLRLALQMLLQQIGKPGKNINDDIKSLVSEGLSVKIQQSLDIMRVIGNNAVHPGQIDFNDNADIALHLFKILNIIAEELVSKPKELDALYNNIIPETARQHIEQRDKKL